ncbi:GNAT family N-acetyltransferase [Virgibacillus sp. JSM 102003]|uniref:GNAT family N-acetyltransferase n=1 Tax=Virgibacillus sp. JSM 102003 TaxID=1562108 RepID=UPI0035C12B55
MIRVYRDKEDKGRILALIEKMGIEEDIGDLDEVIKNSSHLLLYEESGIKGFSYGSIYMNDGESIAQVSVYVEPNSRLKGIGSALYREMEELIYEAEPDFLCTYMRVESENPIGFAKKMGLKKWWGSPELVYRGGSFPETDLEFVKYEDKFFDQFVKVVQDSYYELHEMNDIKPYLASEDSVKKYKLHKKSNVYLVLENDQIVSSVTIGEGEIENLMVAPSYQGKGYGRKSLQFGMNKMLGEGCEEIYICFVEGNEGAERLYTSLGFKPLHNTQVYRKFLKGGS